MRGRRGLVAEAAAVAGVALLGIGMYLWSANARTRNEAQKQQWELANQAMNSNAPNAAVDALQSFKQTQMQNLRGATAEGAGNMAPAALGPLGVGADVVQNVYQANDAVGALANEVYGGPPSNAQAELIRAQGNAAAALARRVDPKVADSRALHAQIIRRYQQYGGMSPAVLGEARKQNPRWQGLSDQELIGALVRRDGLTLASQAKQAYEDTEWQLSQGGHKPTPQEIMVVVDTLFKGGAGDQVNEAGYKAALAAAVAALQFGGSYSGTFTAGSAPGATGNANLTVTGTALTGSMSAGGSGKNFFGQYAGSLVLYPKGTLDPATGVINGENGLSGTFTLTDEDGTQKAPVAGSFTAKLAGGKITGQGTVGAGGDSLPVKFDVSKQ